MIFNLDIDRTHRVGVLRDRNVKCPVTVLLGTATGRFGPIPVRTPGRFGPTPFRSGRFGPILAVGRFGPILAGRFGPFNVIWFLGNKMLFFFLASPIDFIQFS